jgi:hypothetical protein
MPPEPEVSHTTEQSTGLLAASRRSAICRLAFYAALSTCLCRRNWKIGCGDAAAADRLIRAPLTELRLRMRQLAQTRIRYGYRKIRVLLIREGWQVGKKLAYRRICKTDRG